MAGVGDEVNGEVESHDLGSLLSGAGERDFLVRSSNDQVNISNLDGKIVGLYFSGSWCGPCRRFTPKLIEAYGEIVSKGNAFEVVFVSSDKDEESFSEYFSKMPWLAIPFSDTETRSHLKKLFKVRGIPHLVVLDGNGKVLTHEADEILMEHGSEGYPFTAEKIKELREIEETAKREQTLQSVLTSPSCDYVISNSGNKVPIPELEGKIVGLYFFIASFGSCQEFTPRLVEMYGKLKEKGENFEVILIPLGEDKSAFEESFASMPWLAVPFKDQRCEKLARYFEIRAIPTLVVLGSDGKTLKPNAAEVVEVHGIESFPFSPEKLKELEEKDQAKLDSQTLESLLVSGEQNFVIGKDGITVPVSELVGKNILLYFSAHWCGPCRAFMPKLIEAYHNIKEKDSAFEVVFISSDRDHESFDDFFAGMPWLALPFGDERKKSLSRTFKIRGIPSLVAIGPTGRTVTKETRNLLMVHGADAYPFTEERIKELDAQLEEKAKGWPKKVKHELHEEHELILTRRNGYGCDKCGEMGYVWSYLCAKCDFDMHPKCALEEKGKNGEEAEEEEQGQAATKDGYVCDGDVCRKA